MDEGILVNKSPLERLSLLNALVDDPDADDQFDYPKTIRRIAAEVVLLRESVDRAYTAMTSLSRGIDDLRSRVEILEAIVDVDERIADDLSGERGSE